MQAFTALGSLGLSLLLKIPACYSIPSSKGSMCVCGGDKGGHFVCPALPLFALYSLRQDLLPNLELATLVFSEVQDPPVFASYGTRFIDVHRAMLGYFA